MAGARDINLELMVMGDSRPRLGHNQSSSALGLFPVMTDGLTYIVGDEEEKKGKRGKR